MVADDVGRNSGSVAAATSAVSSPAKAKTPLPGLGVYEEDQAAAEKAYADSMNEWNTKEKGIFSAAGFNATGTQIDGNNPYGGYQQLKRGQAQRLDQAREASYARHLGGKGLGAQVADAPIYDNGVQDSEFERDYLGQIAGVAAGRSSAGRERTLSLNAARQRQIELAIQQGAWGVGDGGEETDDQGFPVTSSPNKTKLIKQKAKAPAWQRQLAAVSRAKQKAYGPKPTRHQIQLAARR